MAFKVTDVVGKYNIMQKETVQPSDLLQANWSSLVFSVILFCQILPGEMQGMYAQALKITSSAVNLSTLLTYYNFE